MSIHPQRLLIASDEAQRLWRFALAKQGVCTTTQRDWSAANVAEAALGLHAARLASPITTVAARKRNVPGLNQHIELDDRHLITVRCMRMTLHTLPAPLATVCHAATVHYRLRNVIAMARREGYAPPDIREVADSVVQLLGAHPHLGHRDIEQQLVAAGKTVVASRLGLKLAWEDGRVVYRNRSTHWLRERRTFELAHRVPGFSVETLDPRAAQRDLIVAYFERYGPASVKDCSWWSGLPQRLIAHVLADEKAIEIQTPWSANPCFMLPSDYEAQLDWSEPSPAVSLLAHEDVALKAYFETRERYMHGLPQRRIFNSIGEVRPAILGNGVVVGEWRWDAAARRVRYRHFAGRVEPSTGSAARLLETWLQRGLRQPPNDPSPLADSDSAA